MNPLNWKNLFLLSLIILPFSFALNPTASIDLPIVRVLFPLTFLCWFFSSLFHKQILLDTRLRFWIFSFFLFFCAISIFWATEKLLALNKLFFLLSFFPVYFITYAATSNVLFRERLIKTFFFISFLSALFSLLIFSLQFILGVDGVLFLASKTSLFFLGRNFSAMVIEFPSWLVNIGGKTIMRTFGSFPDPHLFSLSINLSLPFAFYLWKKTSKSIYLWGGLICLLASLLSFSRASYIALFLGCSFATFFFSNPLVIIKKYFSNFLLFLFLFFILLLVPNPLTQRFTSSFNLQEGSNSGRLEMWRLATETTIENPLLGVGLGNFAKYNFPMSSSDSPIYAHNLFLDFSSEIGVLGGLLLIASLFCPLFVLRKNSSALLKTIGVAMLIFIVHSFFETPFYSVRVFPLLLFILAIKTDD